MLKRILMAIILGGLCLSLPLLSGCQDEGEFERHEEAEIKETRMVVE